MGETRHYQKGLGARAEILPVLAKDYRSALIDWMQTHGRLAGARGDHDRPGPRVRLLLRGRPRGRIRVRGAPSLPRPPDLHHRGDHPQSSGQPPAPGTRDPAPSRRGERG